MAVLHDIPRAGRSRNGLLLRQLLPLRRACGSGGEMKVKAKVRPGYQGEGGWGEVCDECVRAG